MKCKQCAWFREREPIEGPVNGPYITLGSRRMTLDKAKEIVGYCESPHLLPTRTSVVLEEMNIRDRNRCTRYNSLEHKQELKIINKGW